MYTLQNQEVRRTLHWSSSCSFHRFNLIARSFR